MAKSKPTSKKTLVREIPELPIVQDDDEEMLERKVPKRTAAQRTADEEEEDYFHDVEDEGKPESKKKPAAKKSHEAYRPKETLPTESIIKKTKKKVGGKKGEILEKWEGAQRPKQLDVVFTRQAELARKKFGHSSAFIGSEATSLVVGIPTPAFVFEYVTGQDCFPLGLVLQIVAKHGVGKSGLVAEFGRWFSMADGGSELCENETKFNSFWYEAIMGADAFQRMPLYRCDSVEDWQQKLTSAVKNMQEYMTGSKKEPGPGRIFPVLYAVDSIMGKMSRENQEKILGKVGKKGKLGTTGQGFADPRSYPIEAGSITKYMRTFPQLIDNWPFALVLVNHLRIKQDDMGNQERNKTGGEQVNFQESFELELKKTGGHKKKIACQEFEGVPLELSCEKNSFGPTGRKAQLRLIWWHETDSKGREVQKTIWDWDWATVHLLDTLLNGENQSTYYRSRLKDMGFHLECPTKGDSDNLAWSRNLGMTAKDTLPWREVGEMIRKDRTLLNQLRDALGIARRPRLIGDYTELRAELLKEMP